MKRATKDEGPWVWWMSEKAPFDIGRKPNPHDIVFRVHDYPSAEAACRTLNELERALEELRNGRRESND